MSATTPNTSNTSKKMKSVSPIRPLFRVPCYVGMSFLLASTTSGEAPGEFSGESPGGARAKLVRTKDSTKLSANEGVSVKFLAEKYAWWGDRAKSLKETVKKAKKELEKAKKELEMVGRKEMAEGIKCVSRITDPGTTCSSGVKSGDDMSCKHYCSQFIDVDTCSSGAEAPIVILKRKLGVSPPLLAGVSPLVPWVDVPGNFACAWVDAEGAAKGDRAANDYAQAKIDFEWVDQDLKWAIGLEKRYKEELEKAEARVRREVASRNKESSEKDNTAEGTPETEAKLVRKKDSAEGTPETVTNEGVSVKKKLSGIDLKKPRVIIVTDDVSTGVMCVPNPEATCPWTATMDCDDYCRLFRDWHSCSFLGIGCGWADKKGQILDTPRSSRYHALLKEAENQNKETVEKATPKKEPNRTPKKETTGTPKKETIGTPKKETPGTPKTTTSIPKTLSIRISLDAESPCLLQNPLVCILSITASMLILIAILYAMQHRQKRNGKRRQLVESLEEWDEKDEQE